MVGVKAHLGICKFLEDGTPRNSPRKDRIHEGIKSRIMYV